MPTLGRKPTPPVFLPQPGPGMSSLAVIAAMDIFSPTAATRMHWLQELMGRATGLVGGRGGSQHIQWRNFYSNGIQGGIVPLATGAALAEKVQQTGNVALVFIGDGTLGEGVLYESLNIASLWQIPVLFVVENNRYAQTTPIALGVAGSISARFTAFDIKHWERDTTDVLEIHAAAEEALGYVRRQTRPAALILHTYRFSAHSKGDDIRDRAEIEQAKKHDPLLAPTIRLDQNQRATAETEVLAIVDDAFTRAFKDPFPVLKVES